MIVPFVRPVSTPPVNLNIDVEPRKAAEAQQRFRNAFASDGERAGQWRFIKMPNVARRVESWHDKSQEGAALAPVVPVDGHIAAELDEVLSALGCRAAAGDRASVNALYAAYAPRLGYWIRRAQRTLEQPGADRALEPADIAQQAFIVFAEMLHAWEDDHHLSRYILAYFPWRLSDAVRAMRDNRPRDPLQFAPVHLMADASWAGEEAVALLEALAVELPERERQVLLMRVRDGMSWSEIARVGELDRRTMFRIWKRVVMQLRQSLGCSDSSISRGRRSQS